MGEDLDISTSVEFVKERAESTLAAQAEITATWQWDLKTLAAWQADADELIASDPTSLAGKALADDAAYQQARGALEARLLQIKAVTTVANGVMRVRAKQDPSLAQAVRPLKSGTDSWTGIEREGSATLAVWTAAFGPTFTPAPGKTHAAFKQLFDGDPANLPEPIPSLDALKKAHKQAEKKARVSKGKLNQLITRLEDDCTQWYAEATSVFRKNTPEGAMIRANVPSTNDYNPVTAPPTAITIQATSVTGPTTVLITYAAQGGGGATSRKLQWRLSSSGTWGDYGTVIRPSQIASHASWAQQSIVFRVAVSNSIGTAQSPEVMVSF